MESHTACGQERTWLEKGQSSSHRTSSASLLLWKTALPLGGWSHSALQTSLPHDRLIPLSPPACRGEEPGRMKPALPRGNCVDSDDTRDTTSAVSPFLISWKTGTAYPATGSIVLIPGLPLPSNQVQKRHTILTFLHFHPSTLDLGCAQYLSPVRLAGLSAQHSLWSTSPGPQSWPPWHRSQRVLCTWKHHHLLPLPKRQLCLWRLKASPSPSLHYSSPKKFPALGPKTVLGLRTKCGPPRFHFLKGVSLWKVCQNREGFLLGSARANTCCWGTLVGTVMWRWWTGCKPWCGGAVGHPL